MIFIGTAVFCGGNAASYILGFLFGLAGLFVVGFGFLIHGLGKLISIAQDSCIRLRRLTPSRPDGDGSIPVDQI